MTITIEYLEDPNGEQQVLEFLSDLADKAMLDDDYSNLLTRIDVILTILEEIGVPEINNRTHFAKGHKDQMITLVDIVKELTNHPPLLETRANWRAIGNGAFRAIFFYEKDRIGNQTIYFTQAVLKEDTYSPAFEKAVQISEQMMYDFYSKKGGTVKWDNVGLTEI